MKLGTFYGKAWINERIELEGSLRVFQERIDISTDLPKPDPRWSTVDSSGHFHAMSGKEYPTLRSKSVDMPCDGSCCGACEGEGYSVTEWSCRLCGEVIEPGMVPGPHRETMPGVTEWSAEVAGLATDDLTRLAMSYAETVMVRFDVVRPKPWQLFGPALVTNGNISGGFGSTRVGIDLHCTGAFGERSLGSPS